MVITRAALQAVAKNGQTGLAVERYFTREDTHPYDELEWELRDAVIRDFSSGDIAFEQRDVEFPTSWSMNATTIVAQKYFRGPLGSPSRERSVRQMIDRVADQVTDWGRAGGYFADEDSAEAFNHELKHLLVHQKAAFNSPVWFNVGVEDDPQCSACQPWHALVSTPEGYRPIGEIVDEGLTGLEVHDAGGSTRVVAVKDNGAKRVHRVVLRDGTFVEATGDHLVRAVRQRGQAPEWLRVDELDETMRLRQQPHRPAFADEAEASELAVSEAALAGWLQADGFVGQYDYGTNRSLTLEFMTADQDEHAWIKHHLDVVFPDCHRKERPVDGLPEMTRIRLYGTHLEDFVERYGLRDRRHDIRVPSQLWTAPKEVVAAYLQSLFQAEGYVSMDGSSALVGFGVISEQWTEDVQLLLLRLGIYARRYRKREKRADRSDLWVVEIAYHSERDRFWDELPFIGLDKQVKLEATLDLEGKSVKDVRDVQIAEIVDLGEQRVYDIQTESGEYLSNAIEVHNCFILSVEDRMSSILNWYAEEGMIFKGGSGSGVNLSRIRSSHEPLKGGGEASGPVSFMRGADASAGTIKCLHRDTPITTEDGVVPIGEVEAGTRVLTRFGFQEAGAVHDNGVRSLVRVRTGLGDEILCTPEHRFWVRGSDGEGWREAQHLRDDDHLLIDLDPMEHGRVQELEPVGPGHHNEISHTLPETLDEALALWLGWVYGDGSISQRESANFVAVQIGDKDQELVDRYTQITRTLFGDDAHVFVNRKTERDASASVRLCSTQVLRFLGANGLRKGKADELRVPGKVAASPPGVRAAFLSGLFEADGHVANGYPYLSTISGVFARDVHRQLLSLGIPSHIRENTDRSRAYGSAPIFTVRVVGGEGVRRFAKLVGFVSERKSQAMADAVARKDNSRYETEWVLPHDEAELDAVWQAGDEELRRAVAPYTRYSSPRSMSLLRARSLLDEYPDVFDGTALPRFVEAEQFFTTATVEPAGEGPVFDLTVDGVHEYLVNNVVTHNSGGKTRRAAKMVVLDVDHPDVEEFIWCKHREEQKARALEAAGFDMAFDGKDTGSIQYQNANNSVRVTDEFMRAVEADADFELTARTTGETIDTVKARDVMRQIAQAAWECADPGVQYDTTINDWHTTPNAGRITASNPCSEYMHLDNSACNLASLNLREFEQGGVFDVEAFRRAVEIMFTAQEILVDNSSYPTDAIGANARAYRQLGLGYANLGALLMSQGLAYDSDEGRAWASAITALMTGHAYRTSAEVARAQGPFAGYANDRDGMLRVIAKHKDAADDIDDDLAPANLLTAARESWADALELGTEHGIRNAQATVLAPTGCLVGGSLVPTERGLVRLASLGDPAGEQWQDLNAQVGTDEGPREASKFYVNGSEAVVSVDTARGYRIQGTPRHQIKVVDADGRWVWKRFGDLDEGDTVPLALDQLVGEPQEVTLPPLGEAYWTGERHMRAPRHMTPELAELVGYFMGDGSLHSRGIRLCVAAEDFEVVDHLSRLGKDLFGLEPHVSEQTGYTEVAFHSVRLAQWWEACGFAKQAPGEGHAGKGWLPHIPDAVLHSNDRAVYAAFVRGLFEADGTVTSGYPHWSTTGWDFSRDVQSLLLALGYPTSRKTDVSGWGESDLAVLRLLNTSYNEHWLEEIGFLSDRKRARVHVSDGRQAARADRIPVSRELIDRLAPDNERLRRTMLLAHGRYQAVSRRSAMELYERTGDPQLGRLLGFFYDEIATAELGQDELTYDLSVPDNVTYVANGFVSHNTIGLMMDCDTTGVEPDLGLVKSKKLVGGGTMRIVNQTVPEALEKLGYQPEQIEAIVNYIDEHATVEGAPAFRDEHLPVFDCALGERSISPGGHIRMLGAVQPWLSGSASKTVNMPESATVEDVEGMFIEGWKLGLKAIAIYRDNCKVSQPLSVDKKEAEAAPTTSEEAQEQGMVRRRLPKQRPSQTVSFQVGDAEGYLTAGEYPGDGLGEIFVKLGKQGSTLSGVMDAFAISVSLGLQYGVPLEAYVKKFTNMRFDPAGMTDDPEVKFTSSIVDYIFRRLAIEYLPAATRQQLGIQTLEERKAELDAAYGRTEEDDEEEPKADAEGQTVLPVEQPRPVNDVYGDAPMCFTCGVQMVRAGSCHVCRACGATSGCS